VAFGAGTFLLPCDQVSEDENRTLAPVPGPGGKPRWRNIAPLPLQF